MPHLAAFTRQSRRVRPILLADDGVLDLDRSTDIALRATSQPPEAAVGRPLCSLGWALYASVDTEGEDLPWIHYRAMDNHPAVQWRRRNGGSDNPMMVVQGVVAMASAVRVSNARGLLPCFVGDPDPGVRRVIPELVAENQLWMLIHADLRRSARVRALMDFVVPRIIAERACYEGTG